MNKIKDISTGVYQIETDDELCYLAKIDLPSANVSLGLYSTIMAAENSILNFMLEIKEFMLNKKLNRRIKIVSPRTYRRGGKTVSKIMYMGRSVYLGTFISPSTAKMAADEAAKELEDYYVMWGERLLDLTELVDTIKAKYHELENTRYNKL